MKSNFKYHMDAIRYKNRKGYRNIEVSGWCFHWKKETIDFQVKINGKEVPFQKVTMDRKDLLPLFNDSEQIKDAGFFITVPLTEEPERFELLLTAGDEKEIAKTLHAKALSRIEDTHSIDYAVDQYEYDSETALSSIWGWASSIDHAKIEYEIRDSKGNEVEFTFRKQERTDFFDEYRKYSGFYIVFTSEEKEKYTLFLKGKTETRRVPLTNALDVHSHSMMSYLRKINSKNIRKAGSYVKRYGVKQLAKRMVKGPNANVIDYNTWAQLRLPSEEELNRQRNHRFEYQPKISLIVATFNTPIPYIKEMIRTVEEQTYANWELCIADGSTEDDVQDYIKAQYADFDKIRFTRLKENYGISGNMNAAMDLATGDYIGLYDHDDTLTPNALFEYVRVLNEYPALEVIYSDEDKTDSEATKVFEPHFKPDFNFDLLCTTNYICHFLVVKKTLIDQVGQLRSAYDGAQDYDFVLRCTDAAGPEKIHHIPKVLYHWRFHQNSTAGNPESKMWAFEAGLKTIQDYYDRKGIHAKAEHGPSLGMYRTRYILDTHPLVSIIIPNKDHIDDLSRCIASIEEKSTYDNYEYVIVENNSTDPKTFDYYQQLQQADPKVRVVTWHGDFNFSAINNYGVSFARGAYYLLLNNDTEVIEPRFIEEMLGYCMRQDVGAVGARLLYPDDTVQHGGVIVGLNGVAGHCFVNLPKDSLGYFGRVMAAQDYSAVTAACMMVKKEAFDAVHGLTELLKVAFNDIDFCLKLCEKGYKVVYNPYCELYHYESKSRGEENTLHKMDRFNEEIEYFHARWHDILTKGDPYYNPNLSLTQSDFSLRQE